MTRTPGVQVQVASLLAREVETGVLGAPGARRAPERLSGAGGRCAASPPVSRKASFCPSVNCATAGAGHAWTSRRSTYPTTRSSPSAWRSRRSRTSRNQCRCSGGSDDPLPRLPHEDEGEPVPDSVRRDETTGRADGRSGAAGRGASYGPASAHATAPSASAAVRFTASRFTTASRSPREGRTSSGTSSFSASSAMLALAATPLAPAVAVNPLPFMTRVTDGHRPPRLAELERMRQSFLLHRLR